MRNQHWAVRGSCPEPGVVINWIIFDPLLATDLYVEAGFLTCVGCAIWQSCERDKSIYIPEKSLSWNRPKNSNGFKIWIHVQCSQNFSYIVGMDHVCRKTGGHVLSEKSAFDGTFFLNNCCRKKYSCKIRRLVVCLSRDKPCRSVTNRDKPWRNRDVDQKLYLNARTLSENSMTHRDAPLRAILEYFFTQCSGEQCEWLIDEEPQGLLKVP